MDKNRIFMLLIGLATVGVLAGGFLLGVQPALQSAAASDATRQQVIATNRTNQATLDALIAQNKKVGELTDQLNELRQSVPSSENIESFVDTVRVAASAEGLVVQDITPAQPAAYAPQGASAPTAASTPAPAASSTPTPTPTPSPAAAAGAAPQSIATHTDPSISAANFLSIPIKVGVAGPLDHAIAFVHRLQDGSRLFLVSGFVGGVDGGGARGGASTSAPSETYEVSGYVFVLAKAAAPTPAPTASK